jgi:hypothetical protein
VFNDVPDSALDLALRLVPLRKRAERDDLNDS